MSSYGIMQTRIAGDLTRTDLGAQIKDAIQDAVKLHEVNRYWFNITRAKTFVTVANQANYGSAALADIPFIYELFGLFLLDGASRFALDFIQWDDFEVIAASPSKGRPTCYTRIDAEILLWPTPNAVWTLRPHMHTRFGTLFNDVDTNAWMVEGERLIRAQAKWYLYTNVIEDDEGAARMLPQIVDAKARLDIETSKRMADGIIRPSPGHF